MSGNNVAYVKVKKVLDTEYIFDIELETGIVIHVRRDGTAIDDSGILYYSVSKVDEDDEEQDVEVLGWSSEISEAVTL